MAVTPYSADLTTKILTFLNRSQTKIAETAKLIAKKTSEDSPYQTYKDEVETAKGLISFVRSLDNVFNDWTELEISQFIDKWTAKANLNNVAYTEHGNFNTRFTVPFLEVTNLGSGNVWGLITGTLSNQTDLQAALDAKANISTTAVALVDGATIAITAVHHTLTTALGRTFTRTYTGDSFKIEITLNATSATFTLPAGDKGIYNGTPSGTNTLVVEGATSGDVIIVVAEKIGTVYYWVGRNAIR